MLSAHRAALYAAVFGHAPSPPRNPDLLRGTMELALDSGYDNFEGIERFWPEIYSAISTRGSLTLLTTARMNDLRSHRLFSEVLFFSPPRRFVFVLASKERKKKKTLALR